VIYLGLRVPVADIVAAAAEEDATVIGISVLSGHTCPSPSSCSPRCAPLAWRHPWPSAGRSRRPTPTRCGSSVWRACSPWAPAAGVVEGVLQLAGPEMASR
jgi:hypothetical protein